LVESLGDVPGHELHGVGVVGGIGEADFAAGFAVVVEVLEEVIQRGAAGDGLLGPLRDEDGESLGGFAVRDGEVFDRELYGGGSPVIVVLRETRAGFLDGIEDRWAAAYLGEHRSEFGVFFPSGGEKSGAEFGGIDSELRQRSDAEEGSVVSDVDERAQNGQRVAYLGRFEDVDSADEDWDVAAAELACDRIAMAVLAVEDGRVLPRARFVHAADDVSGAGGVKVLDGVGDLGGFGGVAGIEREIREFDGVSFFSGMLARGGERHAHELAGGDHRIAVDDLERATENGRERTAVLIERDICNVRELILEVIEGSGGRSAKAVDGLIGVANGEDVLFGSGEETGETDLRDVGVLEFVDEDKAGAALLFGENRGIGAEQADGARDHVSEGAEIAGGE